MSLPYRGPIIRQRPPGKTLGDWLAIAVGPVLIMGMTGSLVFFLAQVGYRGSFSGQMYWTLFWFTVASVLVSRITIEQGAAYGTAYGVALGSATAIRMIAFLGAPLGALLLLGVIWWCASKLTWDCTLIDDDEDASGEGLLRHAGFEAAGSETGVAEEDGKGKRVPRAAEATRRAHAPGLWVIYVALGALPVFGVGQWTLPVSDAEGRLQGFLLAFLFVASALALLLTSSFLGIRRYLRQRHLAMPLPMARSWIGLGTALLAAVLAAALFLPRPRGLETLAGLGWGLTDRPQKASSLAWSRGEAAQGPGREMGAQGRGSPDQGGAEAVAEGENGRGGSHGPDGGESAATGEGPGGADRRPGPGGGQGGGTGGPPERDGVGGTDAPAPSPEGPTRGGRTPMPLRPPVRPSMPSVDLLSVMRVLSWLFALGLGAYLLVRFGRGWLEALRKAMPARRPSAPKPAAAPSRVPRFPGFANPFGGAQEGDMSPQELAVYTFTALEAWAADAGRERREDETPMEFGEGLVRRHPEWHEELRGAVRVYASVAYGGRTPSADSIDLLRRLWARWG